MKIGKECQKIGKFAVSGGQISCYIPINKIKYMPCIPNATLCNDENLWGITLWVRKMPSCVVSTKN